MERPPSSFSRLGSWLAARLDRFAAYPPEDFERKADAITRAIIAVTFAACVLAVITAGTIRWILAS